MNKHKEEKQLTGKPKYWGRVNTSACCDGIAVMNPGRMLHSRWLKTSNRLLRLYIASPITTEILLIVVEYIMNVYVSVWF